MRPRLPIAEQPDGRTNVAAIARAAHKPTNLASLEGRIVPEPAQRGFWPEANVNAATEQCPAGRIRYLPELHRQITKRNATKHGSITVGGIYQPLAANPTIYSSPWDLIRITDH